MHLIAATPGAVEDGAQPVDLRQTPADLVILSAADSDLALLSDARAAMEAPPSLRLASLAHLAHPLSVDLHLDQCATGSRLVIARILGGTGYWRYGLTQYSARLAEAGVPFVALPGDDKPDAELRALSTVSDADYAALWACFVEGGPENAITLLRHARAMIDGAERPEPARPLLRAGLYWPGQMQPDLASLRGQWTDCAPVIPIVFYRSVLQGGGLDPINRLTRALSRKGLNPLPLFVASLKDPLSRATIQAILTEAPPEVILNCTSFSVASPHQGDEVPDNPLDHNDAPVLQVILSGGTEESWRSGLRGLSATDIAMNVALPEVDGRILTRAISFKGEALFDPATQCSIATHQARADRVAFVADLAANWARLRRTPRAERKVALILANYPNKDGRLANGVGLDTPAATLHALRLLQGAGYDTGPLPDSPQALMDRLMSGPTNWLTDRAERQGGEALPLDVYKKHFNALPWDAKDQIGTRWESPDSDPFVVTEAPAAAAFKLSLHRFGNVMIGIQPARGYNIDPTETYHSPDLVPPHNYLAFYIWLRHHWGADAIVHMGKHGNLEWLPGKAIALSETCWPEIALGPLPHVYPFIVNDPGEGTQAKRRAQGVILDHLTPPLTRAETYGPLRDLEALVDEYYEAAGVDPRRIRHLRTEIITLCAATGMDRDVGMQGADDDADLARLDAFLCDLKEAQIRDGLHIFGQSPEGRLARDLAIALVRIPRGDGDGANASFLRALAEDFGLGIDPLSVEPGGRWAGPKPEVLTTLTEDGWRTNGDTVERLELLAIDLLEGRAAVPGPRTERVLDEIRNVILPMIASCGPSEGQALLRALDGRSIPPGPSGAPTRGRLDVLPTGRNFYSVDARAVPTPAAWKLGWESAGLLVEDYLQRNGDWPRAMLLTAWGTANMRTGGDDIAQALALMGVKPTWDAMSRRVTGFEVLPLSLLGRPRVDVTLRISGFFRDAFPQLIALVDSAARAIQELEEPEDMNPAATRTRAGEGRARVFGSKPGAYGAGLQALIDEGVWSERDDLGRAYLEWGGYAYESGKEGQANPEGFAQRLGKVEAIVQNQDNREHDLLDSDDYYQFEGGAAAAVALLQGRDRPVYHNDHSRPERPVIRTLEDEIARVIRSRVANPKWIAGVMRHGYKGAFEMAATVDYLFAFAATTGAVRSHHFDVVEEAFLADPDVLEFLRLHNSSALREMALRFLEALDRGYWYPRSNAVRGRLEGILSG